MSHQSSTSDTTHSGLESVHMNSVLVVKPHGTWVRMYYNMYMHTSGRYMHALYHDIRISFSTFCTKSDNFKQLLVEKILKVISKFLTCCYISGRTILSHRCPFLA